MIPAWGGRDAAAVRVLGRVAVGSGVDVLELLRLVVDVVGRKPHVFNKVVFPEPVAADERRGLSAAVLGEADTVVLVRHKSGAIGGHNRGRESGDGSEIGEPDTGLPRFFRAVEQAEQIVGSDRLCDGSAATHPGDDAVLRARDEGECEGYPKHYGDAASRIDRLGIENPRELE